MSVLNKLTPGLVACALLAYALMALPLAAWAQLASPADGPKVKPNPYGSPLDTLMSTHLWADVPKAKDFVTESRPDPAALDYTPLTGTDPTRPKPRDPAGVAALQAELESGGTQNEARAKGLRSPDRAASRRARRTTAKTAASAASP